MSTLVSNRGISKFGNLPVNCGVATSSSIPVPGTYRKDGVYIGYTVTMSKNDELVLASSGKPQNAVDKIPVIARFAVSDRAKQTLNLVRLHDHSAHEATV